MRARTPTMALAAVLIGCGRPDPAAELAAARNTVERFYEALANYDYADLRATCALDCVVLRGGRALDVEDLLHSLREVGSSGLGIEYELTEVTPRLETGVAWVTFRARRVTRRRNTFETEHAIGSAVVRREAEGWKLVLLQETPVPGR